MGYVEWLRVRGCLKWTAIVIGVLFLVAVAVRVAIVGRQDYLGWALALKSDPGSKVAESTLADGTRRVTIDDPAKQVRVIIDDHGLGGKHMEIYDLSEGGSSDLEHATISMGSVSQHKLPGHGSLTVVDTSGKTDFITYVVAGAFLGFVVATILGAPFAREGDGHLEVALTKPVTRERFGVGALVIDIGGIAAAVALGIAVSIAAHALFELPNITFGARDAMGLVVGILGPIAWYSMLTAATASLRRGYGAVLGFAWPVAGIVLGLSYVRPEGNVVVAIVQAIASFLKWFDPLTYASIHGHDVQLATGGPLSFGYEGQIAGLAALIVLYSIVSLVQWRRIEA